MSQVETDRGEPGEDKSAKEGYLDYVRGLEFGSVAYLAYCDYRRYEIVFDEVHNLQDQLEKPDPFKKVRTESDLRTAEQKMALLEFQTDNRKSELRGYREAYEQADFITYRAHEETALALGDLVPKPSEEDIERSFQWEIKKIYEMVDQMVAEKAR